MPNYEFHRIYELEKQRAERKAELIRALRSIDNFCLAMACITWATVAATIIYLYQY